MAAAPGNQWFVTGLVVLAAGTRGLSSTMWRAFGALYHRKPACCRHVGLVLQTRSECRRWILMPSSRWRVGFSRAIGSPDGIRPWRSFTVGGRPKCRLTHKPEAQSRPKARVLPITYGYRRAQPEIRSAQYCWNLPTSWQKPICFCRGVCS